MQALRRRALATLAMCLLTGVTPALADPAYEETASKGGYGRTWPTDSSADHQESVGLDTHVMSVSADSAVQSPPVVLRNRDTYEPIAGYADAYSHALIARTIEVPAGLYQVTVGLEDVVAATDSQVSGLSLPNGLYGTDNYATGAVGSDFSVAYETCGAEEPCYVQQIESESQLLSCTGCSSTPVTTMSEWVESSSAGRLVVVVSIWAQTSTAGAGSATASGVIRVASVEVLKLG